MAFQGKFLTNQFIHFFEGEQRLANNAFPYFSIFLYFDRKIGCINEIKVSFRISYEFS